MSIFKKTPKKVPINVDAAIATAEKLAEKCKDLREADSARIELGCKVLQEAVKIIMPAMPALSIGIKVSRDSQDRFYGEQGIRVEDGYYSESFCSYRVLKGSQLWLTESGDFLQVTRNEEYTDDDENYYFNANVCVLSINEVARKHNVREITEYLFATLNDASYIGHVGHELDMKTEQALFATRKFQKLLDVILSET